MISEYPLSLHAVLKFYFQKNYPGIIQHENSSNVNEAIKTILNFFVFFYEKILHTQKSIKSIKNTKSIKIAKTQTSEQATLLPLDVFYVHNSAAFFVFVCLYVFCVFVRVKSCKKKLINLPIKNYFFTNHQLFFLTFSYFLSVRTYSHLLFIIQNLFSFVCTHFDQQESFLSQLLKIFLNIKN